MPAGTLVFVEIVEPISTRTIKRGDMFSLRLAAPIALGDRVVIPSGAEGMGQVVDAAPSGALGKPAKLLLAARYIEAGGVRIPLRAMKLGAGGTDETNAILAANLVPYVGILADFAHGGEIEIPAGTHAVAKLGADLGADGRPLAPVTNGATVTPEPISSPVSTPPTPTPMQSPQPQQGDARDPKGQ